MIALTSGSRKHTSQHRRARWGTWLGVCTVLAVLPAVAAAAPCVVPDNGGGTVDLPPAGCGGYVSPTDLHMMIDGLPPGTTIRVAAQHHGFANITRSPGGPLGGETETFQSSLTLQLTGTGELTGFARNLTIPAQCLTHTGPRTPGTSPQSFDTAMAQISGQITGDPDFDLLRITAGDNFGMPSPGHTTLTQQGPSWAVDSFFDITYRIDFVGHPGGPLGGMSGSTVGTVRMRIGEPAAGCVVVDDGTGTAKLPPAGCGYVSPNDLHKMINGLPPGTTIEVAAEHKRFFNIVAAVDSSGETEDFGSFLVLEMRGTGGLATFSRDIELQIQCRAHTDPRPPGPLQSFANDMRRLQGQISGDPDFDLLRITGGTDFGMPSPGHTTLTRLPSGDWNVDSFFDVFYRIDFVGSPGGPLGGMSGSTTGTIRMATGTTPTDADPPLPPRAKQSALQAPVPNPFNPSTNITFHLAVAGAVKLQVFDVSGRLVRSLVEANMQPRTYTLRWDGNDEHGRRAPSGSYFVKLIAPDRTDSRSMVLVK